MSLAIRLNNIKTQLPSDVCLVAVSKTKPNEDIQMLYDAGQRIFGENKVQEMVNKHAALPLDIEWHLIGHLQTNKVKQIAPFVSLIHAVDSDKLLTEINKRAEQNRRIINCLLQIKLGSENSKFGLDLIEANRIIQKVIDGDFPNVVLTGLMGMATNSHNEQLVSEEFKQLKIDYEQLQTILPSIQTLSMGMSGDYKLAISQGSNMVRIGSSIFGKRDYSND